MHFARRSFVERTKSIDDISLIDKLTIVSESKSTVARSDKR